MRKLKKRLYEIIWIIIIFLGLYLGIRGFSMIVFSGMENPLNNVMNQVTSYVGKNVMNLYMPVVMQGIGKDEGNLPQSLIEKIFESYPIYRYTRDNTEYETTSESEYTYEMIVAAEAADENYVDHETGEVTNASGTLVEKENEEFKKENDQYINRTQDNEKEEQSGLETDKSDSIDTNSKNENDDGSVSDTTAENTTTEDTSSKASGSEATSSEDTTTEEGALASSTAVTVEPVEYSMEKLADFDFLKNTFYSVDSTTSVGGDKLNAETMLGKDMSIKKDSTVPQILIYHTHSQEAFSDSVEGDESTSIVGVGEYLAQILANTYGYNVIHDTSKYDMINGKLDRNYAFTLAEPDIIRILQENPSIQVVIDLHRDGVNQHTRLVTDINGKPTAQFMFFNGLSYSSKVGNIEYLYNPYIEDNLAFSFQMQLQAAKYYPNLTRKIYLKGYRYNLHLMPRATLVEVGGQTNTVEEAKNAMEPLADILNKVLKGN